MKVERVAPKRFQSVELSADGETLSVFANEHSVTLYCKAARHRRAKGDYSLRVTLSDDDIDRIVKTVRKWRCEPNWPG